MERTQVNAILRTVFTGSVLLFLVVGAVLLAPRLKLKGLWRTSACAKVFPIKTAWVELNGAFTRLEGRRLCNGVCRTEGGLLVSGLKRRDVSEQAASAIQFSRWLAARGTRYVFVQAPAKSDRGDTLHPSSLPHAGNAMADAFLEQLTQAGVETLDLREKLAVTPVDVRRQFYRTDHHWNNEAVFTAFGLVAGRLAEMTGTNVKAVEERTTVVAWKREIWPNCFWGSRGRRTGRLFSGVDDLIVYTPRFPTQMSLEVPSKRIHRTGSFRKTNMWWAKDIQGSGRLEKDAYSFLYVGGLYPHVQHQNRQAPISARIMIIGDSYARPLEALLSTVVSDLVVIDPRRFPKGDSVADQVRRHKPDVVLQLVNTGGFHADVIGRKPTHRSVMFEYGIGLPILHGK